MKNDYIIHYNQIVMDTLNFRNLSLECSHEWTLISKFDKIDYNEHTELIFNICLYCKYIEIMYTTTYMSPNCCEYSDIYTDNEIISLESFMKNIKDCMYNSFIDEIEIHKILYKLELL